MRGRFTQSGKGHGQNLNRKSHFCDGAGLPLKLLLRRSRQSLGNNTHLWFDDQEINCLTDSWRQLKI
jgi:hypothetical protein